MAKINRKLHKQHTRYYNAKGKLLPGITTIVGMRNKPQLISWANKLGLKGIELPKYMKTLADIGKLAHRMIECRVTRKILDISEYCPKDVAMAKNSYAKFERFYEARGPARVILCEKPLVSERYQYGGTPDLLLRVGSEQEHIDFKTGNGIYLEMLIQLAAQRELMIENKYNITNSYILRISRDKRGDFEYRMVGKDLLIPCFNIFLYLLKIYCIEKQIGY